MWVCEYATLFLSRQAVTLQCFAAVVGVLYPASLAGRRAGVVLYVHRGLGDGTPAIHQPVRRQMNGDWALCSHYAPCLIIKGLELMHPASSSQINSSSLSLSAESSLFGSPDSHVSRWWPLPRRKLVNPAAKRVLFIHRSPSRTNMPDVLTGKPHWDLCMFVVMPDVHC